MSERRTSYLERFLDPVAQTLTPETARRIADFRFDAETQERASRLAEKANEGTLSEEERAEYAEYIEAIDLIGILQARARAALHRQTA